MILWLVPAVLCILYGIFVMLSAKGTRFHLVWLSGGAIFLLFAAFARLGLWSKLPGAVRLVLLCLAGLLVLCFLLVEGCILSGFGATAAPGLDYIIVLGAQMKPRGPSRVLRFRLDRAAEYLEESPDTLCIVSGGQGWNEPCTEAAGMAVYLTQKRGIDPARILQEPDSTSTEQNIAFSLKLMPEPGSVGIVTNNFHIHRSLQIARRQGVADAKGLAAGTSPLHLPNNLLREFFGEVKYLIRAALGLAKSAEAADE